jgi:hypothetical protein
LNLHLPNAEFPSHNKNRRNYLFPLFPPKLHCCYLAARRWRRQPVWPDRQSKPAKLQKQDSNLCCPHSSISKARRKRRPAARYFRFRPRDQSIRKWLVPKPSCNPAFHCRLRRRLTEPAPRIAKPPNLTRSSTWVRMLLWMRPRVPPASPFSADDPVNAALPPTLLARCAHDGSSLKSNHRGGTEDSLGVQKLVARDSSDWFRKEPAVRMRCPPKRRGKLPRKGRPAPRIRKEK